MTIRQTIKREIFDRVFQRERLYVLNFHIITPAGDLLPDGFATHTPVDLFRRTIIQLKERYRFVDLHAWWSDAELRKASGHAVAITFDDGHASVFEHALPVLAEFCVPATMFVNSAYWVSDRRVCWSNAASESQISVDGLGMSMTQAIRIARATDNAAIYRRYTSVIEDFAADDDTIGRGYLTIDELKSETSGLIRIGMHGHWHHRHAMFDRDWQADNIRTNMNALQSLPNFVPLFAFPFGKAMDVGADPISLCNEIGVVPVFHNGGYNALPASSVRRIPADGRDVGVIVGAQSPFLTKYDIGN